MCRADLFFLDQNFFLDWGGVSANRDECLQPECSADLDLWKKLEKVNEGGVKAETILISDFAWICRALVESYHLLVVHLPEVSIATPCGLTTTGKQITVSSNETDHCAQANKKKCSAAQRPVPFHETVLWFPVFDRLRLLNASRPRLPPWNMANAVPIWTSEGTGVELRLY